MGRWGTGIFDDDFAFDVARDFEQALDDGLGVLEATQQILAYPPWDLQDEDTGPIIYLALAALQLKYGAIQPELRDQALGIITTGAGMEIWEEAGSPELIERQRVLEQFKLRLSTLPEEQVGESFPPLHRPPRRPEQPINPGDFVSIPLPEGRLGFGQVLLYGVFGVYNQISEHPLAISALRGQPFVFRVLLYKDAVTSWRWSVIGHHELDDAERQQAETAFGDAPHRRIYEHGRWRGATVEECKSLADALWYDAEGAERRLVRTLLEDKSRRTHHMADTQALRPCVETAFRRETEQQRQQEEYRHTSAYREEKMGAFRLRLEAALSQVVLQALDLVYEWDEWLQKPRAFFQLESIKGNADCTIHFGEAHRIWAVFIPNLYRPTRMFESQGLEQGLLVAIGEFWKVQGVLSPSSA